MTKKKDNLDKQVLKQWPQPKGKSWLVELFKKKKPTRNH